MKHEPSSLARRASTLIAQTLAACLVAGCSIDPRDVVLAPGANGSGAGWDSDAGLSGGAQLVLAQSRLDLGAPVTGSTAFGRLTLRNDGAAPTGAVSVAMTSGSDTALAIAQNLCTSALAPGASCEVRVQLLPTRVGDILGALDVGASPGGNARVDLVGRGLAPGDIVLAPADGSSTDWGGVLMGTSRATTFRITNPVAAESGVLALQVAGDGFAVQSGGSPDACQSGVTSLPSGASCSVLVSFDPLQRGSRDGTLSVTSAALGSASLALSGRGLAPAAIALAPAAANFGGVVLGSTGTVSLRVSNDGDQPVSLASIALSPGDASPFSVAMTDCQSGLELSPASSCRVDLAFRPQSAGQATASLAITSADGAVRTASLQGEGLLPGSLVLAPLAGNSADFGDVVVGALSAQTFQVHNPGSEASGPLGLSTSGGFELQGDGQPGQCQAGVTALASGESCTIRVVLRPSERGAANGSLVVSSAVAGSVSVALSGRAILPAVLSAVEQEINFGRVLTDGTAAKGSITIRNAGDGELPAPTLALGTPTSGDASAFAIENGCTTPLAAAAECTVALTFTPTQAVPHSVTLELASMPGGTDSVLLLGEAIAPGSIVLAPAAGASTDFGDVSRGSSATLQLTLTNPGGTPTGLLSITTSDTRFVVDAGNCNPPGSPGLVNGESCTFSVRFTPDDSQPANATISVASPGAGNAALAVTGRGRLAPTLTGSNQLNFGTVILGRQSDPRTWAVANGGDQATGALVLMGAGGEFVVTNDTCTGRRLDGGAGCSLAVAFSPSVAGPRAGTLVVGDPSGVATATLTLAGIGQSLPAIGQPCLDGQCSGTASCETHSNGLSLVCCAEDCTGTQRCAAGQNFLACELPTVGAGQACSATQICQAGLTCNSPSRPGFCCPSNCNGPCQRCSASGTCEPLPDQDRGACGGNKVCVRGNCACSGIDRESLDCGNNRCIRDVADACCDNNGCSGDDVCGGNNLCGCPSGTRECTAGSNVCVPIGNCCPGQCPAGQECADNGFCVDTQLGFGEACDPQNDRCTAPLSCLDGNRCAECSASFGEFRCFDSPVRVQFCNQEGRFELLQLCRADQICANNGLGPACMAANGGACQTNGECLSGSCGGSICCATDCGPLPTCPECMRIEFPVNSCDGSGICLPPLSLCNAFDEAGRVCTLPSGLTGTCDGAGNCL